MEAAFLGSHLLAGDIEFAFNPLSAGDPTLLADLSAHVSFDKCAAAAASRP
jgi:hypothetical protein